MKHSKAYNRMNVEELEAATHQFDREFVIDQARPLTAAERARWARMKRRPGRPRVGQGVEVVSLSIERGLLGRADKLAKKLKISRAKLVSTMLQRALAETAVLRTGQRPKATARPAPRKAA